MVTGATGFVAGHIIEVLLAKGYEVRGTVRDPSNTDKVAHLTALAKAHAGSSISFHKVDLLGGASAFTDVLRGCAGLLHVASPAVLGTSNPYEDLVRPAVEGTLGALRAAADTPTIRSVVVTSSASAIRPTSSKQRDGVVNESDWNDVATLEYGTYPYSKTIAERAAWKFVEEDDEQPNSKSTFALRTIQFPHAFGPQQNGRVTSSNKFLSHLLHGELPILLPMCFDVIDVRDVAQGHVRTRDRVVHAAHIVCFSSACIGSFR